jgi:hypothetical protein
MWAFGGPVLRLNYKLTEWAKAGSHMTYTGNLCRDKGATVVIRLLHLGSDIRSGHQCPLSAM